MTKRERRKRKLSAGTSGRKPDKPDQAISPNPRRWVWLLVFGLLLMVVLGVYYHRFDNRSKAAANETDKPSKQTSSESAPPTYVGAQECQSCHNKEFRAWFGSHHAQSMQIANADTILGNFNNVDFVYNGIRSTFFNRGNQYWVKTDGPDGQLNEYPIRFTFGITPLQQYLIEFPGGRLQALSIAWDSRPRSDGGQRWFHLYPKEAVGHDDPLHWTGRYQNWNLQCAECHSTHLEKRYAENTDTYATRYSEINVACEACHGPASKHVKWAASAKDKGPIDQKKGLTISLTSRWHEAWSFLDQDARIAQRDRPAEDGLMNVCWACHARRGTLAEASLPGFPLEDTHRPALLTEPTYYPDGQQREEDYTWGSFRQSRMFQNGVTCMDCHEPHALQLRAEGNSLCSRCHRPDEFDTEKHHFHKTDTPGAQCVNCHAPERNYMQIDGRHDHSFRLPRPDLSEDLKTPNACTQCHKNRQHSWAAKTMDRWYGQSWRKRPEYGTVLHAGTHSGLKALPSLLQLAQDQSAPAIVRATAASLAQTSIQPNHWPQALSLLTDSDPSVRRSATGLLASMPPDQRLQALVPLLSDPVRGVRIETARQLADITDEQLPSHTREARNKAAAEYERYLKEQADWPVENVNRGNWLMNQGKVNEAIHYFQRALKLDPRFVGAYVNLSDAFRQMNRDEEGEKLLREGLVLMPDAADIHHALGLLLVRQKNLQGALIELAQAAKLAPENARFSYVYAIALNSAGRQKEAVTVLQAADQQHPYDMNLLSALVSISRDRGDAKTALRYAKKVAEALPDNPEVQGLIHDLSTGM